MGGGGGGGGLAGGAQAIMRGLRRDSLRGVGIGAGAPSRSRTSFILLASVLFQFEMYTYLPAGAFELNNVGFC